MSDHIRYLDTHQTICTNPGRLYRHEALIYMDGVVGERCTLCSDILNDRHCRMREIDAHNRLVSEEQEEREAAIRAAEPMTKDDWWAIGGGLLLAVALILIVIYLPIYLS